MALCKDIIKCRDIRFSYDLPDTNHAAKAQQLLADVPGIEAIVIMHPRCLRVRYDVRQLTLQMLETALKEVGFNLDSSIISQIRRGICAYCEEAHRSSLHVDELNHEHPALNTAENLTHDPRPDNWRNYV